jgi:transposase-like protein
MNSILSAAHFHNEEAAFAYVEARLWPNGPVCPFCQGVERIGRLQGKTTRPGLYKCYACKKPFTVRMRTVFESSHVPLRVWLQAIYLVCSSKKGVSTRQLQRMLGGSMTTAWFLGHRIRECMREIHDMFSGPLGGAGMTIEADEAYIGRDAAKKLGPPGKQIPVFALVERHGRIRSFHVQNVTAGSLRPILARHASPDSAFMSDENRIYTHIGWNFASHDTVEHGAHEYVRGDAHTNTVEGYFSILKRGIFGVYHHVSEEHLRRYLSEFDFRYSNREKLGVNDVARANLAIEGAKGKRLTYETTHRAKA